MHDVAAYEVAKEIGLDDMVPETIVREVDGTEGSMQGFVENAVVGIQAGRNEYDGQTDLARATAFDYLIGNTDRHYKNWMISNDLSHKMHLIDNGLAFPNNHRTTWAGNRFLIQRAQTNNLDIPREARSWVDHLPQIKKVMEARGLGGAEYEGVAHRARDIQGAAGFDELGTGFNYGRGG